MIQIPGGLCRDELDEMFIEQTKLLTEATALLERWRNACGYAGFLRDETDTFLSRAPAQHAAPVCHDTSPHACSFQPAAPEPFRGASSGPIADPATRIDRAPEPSGESDDTDNPDYCRGYKDGSDDTARELLHGQERETRLANAVAELAAKLQPAAPEPSVYATERRMGELYKRAESAEAQLAAVRLEALTHLERGLTMTPKQVLALLSTGSGTGETK